MNVGDFVRCRVGCLWLFGVIDEYYGDDFYEVSYGNRKRYEKIKDGWSFDYFGSFHKSDLKLIEP
jgi:hypothetical protein